MKWVLEFIVVEKEEKCIRGRDNNRQAKLCKFKGYGALRKHTRGTDHPPRSPLTSGMEQQGASGQREML